MDFLAYDILDLLRIFEPKCLDAFLSLKAFVAHFEGLKNISAYMPVASSQALWTQRWRLGQ